MGVMAVAGAATTIMGDKASKKSAKSVEEAKRIEQENMITENRRRATDDYLTQTRLEQDQQSQEESAVALKSNDVMRETIRATSTSTASAAERGVAGRTINDIAADYDFQANEETGRLKYNQSLSNRQHGETIAGYGKQFSNRVADVRPYVERPIAPVDYFGPIFAAGGQIAGNAGVGKAVDNFMAKKNTEPTAPAPGKTAWGTY